MRLQLIGAGLLVLVTRPGTAQQTAPGPVEPPLGTAATRRVTGTDMAPTCNWSLRSDSIWKPWAT